MTPGLRGTKFGILLYCNFPKSDKDLLWAYLYAAKGYSTTIWFDLYKKCVIDLL